MTDAESLIPNITCSDDLTDLVKADEVEIILRTHLMDLLEDCSNGGIGSDSATLKPICAFIESAVSCCLQKDRLYLAKVPFLLIEDAIDSLDSNLARSLWVDIVNSSYKSKLSDPSYFSKGKLTLLRFCNKFLQKLTSKCNKDDIEFSGDVLSFLTELFPLSERSALNVTGKYNVENKAAFESKEEFEQLTLSEQEAHLKGTQVQQGIMDTSTEDDTELYGDLDLPIHHPDRLPIDYHFYKTFWGIQGDLRQPNKFLNDSTFSDFVRSLNSVLEAFEGFKLDKVISKSDGRFKSSQLYLTSSRLLRLQMHDSEMRIHILVQILIVLSYLSSKSTSKHALEAFAAAKQRTENLLRMTPTDGKEVLALLTHILSSRENIWTKWKDEGCKPFEKSEGVHEFEKTIRIVSTYSDEATMPEENESPILSDSLLLGVPKLESFVEDYVDALDPESGIEEEYHPKNNKLFCWQSLRLIRHCGLTNKLAKVVGNGDMEGVIREIWKDKGVTIPGESGSEIDGKQRNALEQSLFDEINGSPAIEEKSTCEDGEETEETELKDRVSDKDDLFGSSPKDSDGEISIEEQESLFNTMSENDRSNVPSNRDELQRSGQVSEINSGLDKKTNTEDEHAEAKLNSNHDDSEIAVIDNIQKIPTNERTSPKVDKPNSPILKEEHTETTLHGLSKEVTSEVVTSAESKLWKVIVKNLPLRMNAHDFLKELERRGCRPLFVDVSYFERERLCSSAAIFYEAEAKKTVKTLEHARINGKLIQAKLDKEFERPKVQAKDASKCKIIIGNLPNDVPESAFLSEIQAIVGKFKNIDFPNTSNRDSARNKGYAFVSFATPVEARCALLKLNRLPVFGTRFPLRVEFSQDKSPIQQRQSTHNGDSKALSEKLDSKNVSNSQHDTSNGCTDSVQSREKKERNDKSRDRNDTSQKPTNEADSDHHNRRRDTSPGYGSSKRGSQNDKNSKASRHERSKNGDRSHSPDKDEQEKNSRSSRRNRHQDRTSSTQGAQSDNSKRKRSQSHEKIRDDDQDRRRGKHSNKKNRRNR